MSDWASIMRTPRYTLGVARGWPMSCHKARLLVGWKSTNRAPKWGTASAVTSILRESFTVYAMFSPEYIMFTRQAQPSTQQPKRKVNRKAGLVLECGPQRCGRFSFSRGGASSERRRRRNIPLALAGFAHCRKKAYSPASRQTD